jgi:hypothetical protein
LHPLNVAQVKHYLAGADDPPTYMTVLHSARMVVSSILPTSSAYPPFSVHVTETLVYGDPRSNSGPFTAVKQKKIESLIARGTFRVILREELPTNANLLNGRLYL